MAVKWMGKLVGGGLGLILGPIGAVVGVVIGHQYDEYSEASERDPRLSAGANLADIGERFFRGTFRVMGYLAKSDGRVTEREIAAARGVMTELRLNPQQVQAALGYFTPGKQ